MTKSATLRDVTVGDDGNDGITGYFIDEPGIDGLGVPSTKSADLALDGRNGSYAAPDFLDVRVITIPVLIIGTDEDDTFNGLAELNTAWAPATDGVDLTLELTLPGWGDVILLGRPRGVEVDTSEVGENMIRALCRFDALDPNIATAGS